ncbi:hypothetical protein EQG41_20955 [Billgrantia azerbaijanica]|nr:hypothetical protein EQG41_20955 [Halomonas azerbaijanica]
MSNQTYGERLILVREAIDKLLQGSQSWRFGDRQYTRADLATLERMERHYAKMASREEAVATGRGGRNRVRYIGW